MISITPPATVANPLTGFNVNYTLSGSKYGVGAASAQLYFYLSTTPNGSGPVWLLDSRQILLQGNGLGPYYPPSGTQTVYMHRVNMQASTVAQLEAIAAACQPQTYYILGFVDNTPLVDRSLLMGSTKPPDFYFSGGTLSPNTIQPGGAADLSFTLATQCPVSTGSHVGIYLTDPSFQVLEVIGAVSVGTGAGPFSLPPTPITFSSAMPLGSYRIVLVADANGVVTESNENNNVGYFELQVTSGLLAQDDPGQAQELSEPLPFDAASVLSEFERGASVRRDVLSF
ncbi:hypothetical protein [Myxococcus vastator]|uniref:hypothetical protein n=1 Tax=Myxococcus vastator TaxID=2709664 RepID=UPI0019689D23|nr:hypothetical protein [Myxococcus vastator]